MIKEDLEDDHKRLKKQGELLAKTSISSAYFVHGTFVGNDPFNIVDYIESILPKFTLGLLTKIRIGIRKSANIIVRDIGNFTTEYEEVFKNITHNKINTIEFTWSSANNHIARVKAAIDLIENLYTNHPDSNARVLLVGHSHAGQVFSLVTKIINNKKFRHNLEKILESNEYLEKLHEEKINHLSQMSLDFVTFGTPVRYTWELNKKNNLIHFINHRGDTPFGGDFKGLFNTSSGDYIQQWGTAGSDLFSLNKRDELTNKQLDSLLGTGRNIHELRENISKKNRLHNEGMHLLVDYGDNSYFPNFIKTAFGHGVYTKIKFLTFHLLMINKYIYQKKKEL